MTYISIRRNRMKVNKVERLHIHSMGYPNSCYLFVVLSFRFIHYTGKRFQKINVVNILEDSMKLWVKILLGLLLGIISGVLFPKFAVFVKPVGDIFISSIKMLIVPLIFSSLVVGVTGLKDPKKMGRIGIKTMALYLLTTAVAITIGLTLGTILKPGVGVDLGSAVIMETKEAVPFSQTLLNIVPKNPVKSMAEGNVLQIIVFAILFGISLNFAGKTAEPVIKVIDGIAEAMYKLTAIVMELAPYGVFALMAFISMKKVKLLCKKIR
ncbi:hypothetical protein DID78_05055 [Candidatus Marinamargulisbacteria bacterium SCGC AG-343-D04]|nr:hypothetical protein DID78_05055 [Candidatus Marinamargulisbacteria bacterium SCGC AG-343-D04]